MSVPVKMPQLGESVVEGTVARWHKQPGDAIEKLEPLLDISTDKIDTEVPAPEAGTLLEIVVGEGQTVAAGTVLAYIGDATAAKGQSTKDEGQRTAVGDQVVDPIEKPRGSAFISPVVARMAEEHDLDLAQIEGTGLHGRITKKDVLAHLEKEGVGDRRTEIEASTPHSPIPSPQSPVPSLPSEDETLHPLSAMRRAIAEHMSRSVRTSPHVTTLHEVDMTAVVRHREAHKAQYTQKGVRLTFTPYFVAAVAEALREMPVVNSRFSDEGLIYNRRIHIGVAVAVEAGLLVPVIRDADERNLAGLARAVNDLAERARGNRLSPDELKGGTFTITNHGMGGSLLATPIINQPQAGILGVGAIVKRPVVRSGGHPLLPSADDAIVIRPMCYLSFSFDHRVLDGAEADEFVSKVKIVLENWTDGSITSNE